MLTGNLILRLSTESVLIFESAQLDGKLALLSCIFSFFGVTFWTFSWVCLVFTGILSLTGSSWTFSFSGSNLSNVGIEMSPEVVRTGRFYNDSATKNRTRFLLRPTTDCQRSYVSMFPIFVCVMAGGPDQLSYSKYCQTRLPVDSRTTLTEMVPLEDVIM